MDEIIECEPEHPETSLTVVGSLTPDAGVVMSGTRVLVGGENLD